MKTEVNGDIFIARKIRADLWMITVQGASIAFHIKRQNGKYLALQTPGLGASVQGPHKTLKEAVKTVARALQTKEEGTITMPYFDKNPPSVKFRDALQVQHIANEPVMPVVCAFDYENGPQRYVIGRMADDGSKINYPVFTGEAAKAKKLFEQRLLNCDQEEAKTYDQLAAVHARYGIKFPEHKEAS